MSNAEEFGDWLVAVRGDTTVVVDEHRPVPLWQHMMVGTRMFDLFAGEDAVRRAADGPDAAAPDPGARALGAVLVGPGTERPVRQPAARPARGASVPAAVPGRR